jgi:hypothetical protein
VAMLPDDPVARRLNTVITGTGPMTAALRAAGIRFVLVDAGASPAPRLPGSVIIATANGVTLFEIPMPDRDESPSPR